MRHYNTYDYYNYSNSYVDTIAWGLVTIFTIILIVWAIFSLGSYIIRGIGMYTIAKRLGIDYAWLAFVPFARTYLHGTLSGTILLKKKSIQNPGVWLLALPFLYSAIYSILYAILWSIGLGTLIKIDSYSYMPYSTNISTGNIMGLIVVFLIFMVVGVLYMAFYKAFQVLVDHQILERFTSKNMSIVHAVLCTMIPMYESICLFVMRNRPFNPGMEPPTPTPFMQSPPPGPYYDSPAQTGYSGSSMQGGYGNYGGAPSHTDTNNYNPFNGPSAQTGTDYNSFGITSSPAQTGTDYNNFGSTSSPAQSGTDRNGFGTTPAPADPGVESNQDSSGILQKDPAIANENTRSDFILSDPVSSNKTTEDRQEDLTGNKPDEASGK